MDIAQLKNELTDFLGKLVVKVNSLPPNGTKLERVA